MVFLPSYSVADSLLEHYAARLLHLEHRHLLHLLTLHRVPAARMVFVTSERPSGQVIDYYLSLLPRQRRRDVRDRIRFLEVPDDRPRSVTAKLLDRPDLITELRHLVSERVAYIEPWNVTEAESRLADTLGIPLNGTRHELWPLGFKSAGRRIMRNAGVPVPCGVEDVRTLDEVVAAVEEVRLLRPGATGVVVKADDSGAGAGNRILGFCDLPTAASVRAKVGSWEQRYRDDLALGGVVEERIVADDVAFPSVQVDIAPFGGHVDVVSTHEQLLGGPTGQVYIGCRFPADPAYAATLAAFGEAVGHLLAERGAGGRLSVDFVAVRGTDGAWEVYGLEINLRKTGTTHPFAALANLVHGQYDPVAGQWFGDDGSTRCYRSADHVAHPEWRGRSANDVIAALRGAGLQFDRRLSTGVVLHGFCGLDIDGSLGLTAIGASSEHADSLYQEAVDVLADRSFASLVVLPSTASSGRDDAVAAEPA